MRSFLATAVAALAIAGGSSLPAAAFAGSAFRETAAGEPESPAGRLLAWAEAEGYAPGGEQPTPYQGYFFRRLEVKDPKNEYAVLAYPADYRYTGIMTFVSTQDGAIYAKDLDVQTAQAAAAIKTFTPDESWTREQ